MTARGRLLAALGLGLVAACAVAQMQPGATVGGFRLPEYADDGTLKSQVFGEFAQSLSNGLIEIQGLRVEMYQGEAVETRVTSPHCLYDRVRGSAGSTSSVRITRGEAVITGDDYRYMPKRQRFEIHTNARVVLRDVRAMSRRKPVQTGDAPPPAAPVPSGPVTQSGGMP